MRKPKSPKMDLYDWLVKREVLIQRWSFVELENQRLESQGPNGEDWVSVIRPKLEQIRQETLAQPKGLTRWLVKIIVRRCGWRFTGL